MSAQNRSVLSSFDFLKCRTLLAATLLSIAVTLLAVDARAADSSGGADAALEAAIDSSTRPAQEKARDRYRHPLQTLDLLRHQTGHDGSRNRARRRLVHRYPGALSQAARQVLCGRGGPAFRRIPQEAGRRPQAIQQCDHYRIRPTREAGYCATGIGRHGVDFPQRAQLDARWRCAGRVQRDVQGAETGRNPGRRGPSREPQRSRRI